MYAGVNNPRPQQEIINWPQRINFRYLQRDKLFVTRRTWLNLNHDKGQKQREIGGPFQGRTFLPHHNT